MLPVVPKSPPPKAMPAEIGGQDVKPFPTPDEGDGEDGGDDGHESECGFPSIMKPWRACSIPSQKLWMKWVAPFLMSQS